MITTHDATRLGHHLEAEPPFVFLRRLGKCTEKEDDFLDHRGANR